MSRSLHAPHTRTSYRCPLLGTPARTVVCTVPLESHPGGRCWQQPAGAPVAVTYDRHGRRVTRTAGVDYARRYHSRDWSRAAVDDNRRVRRTNRVTLGELTGPVDDVIDTADGLLLTERDPGLAHLVC